MSSHFINEESEVKVFVQDHLPLKQLNQDLNPGLSKDSFNYNEAVFKKGRLSQTTKLVPRLLHLSYGTTEKEVCVYLCKCVCVCV